MPKHRKPEEVELQEFRSGSRNRTSIDSDDWEFVEDPNRPPSPSSRDTRISSEPTTEPMSIAEDRMPTFRLQSITIAADGSLYINGQPIKNPGQTEPTDLSGIDLSRENLEAIGLTRQKDEAIERSSPSLFFDGDDLEFEEEQRNRVSLSGIDFSGVILSYAKLQGTDCSGGDFSEVDFSHADLRFGNFNEAIFHETNFQGANFTGADCCGADFTNSERDLNTRLKGAALLGAKGLKFNEMLLNSVRVSAGGENLNDVDFSSDICHETYRILEEYLTDKSSSATVAEKLFIYGLGGKLMRLDHLLDPAGYSETASVDSDVEMTQEERLLCEDCLREIDDYILRYRHGINSQNKLALQDVIDEFKEALNTKMQEVLEKESDSGLRPYK